jgi:hypothetical protein
MEFNDASKVDRNERERGSISYKADEVCASNAETTECPIKFVCVPRPFWDFILEHKGENDEDDDDENADSPREKAWNETLEEARKKWLKPATEFPGYTWTVCWFYRYAFHVILIL